ncbi:MAG: ATP-binding protein [Oscillospiraceae bacterium]|nr:ATP-binding protein [Oscillospiraceae bacterium]
MEFDGKTLALARDALAARREQNRAEQDRREREAMASIPGLREVNAGLRGLVGEVIRSAAGSGKPLTPEEIRERSGAMTARRAALLREHGFPADWLDEIVTCPRCSDRGYLRTGEICSCLLELYEAERAKALSAAVKLGEEQFSDFDLSYYSGEDREKMALTLEICKRYAVRFGPDSSNLLFQGGTGLGKTFLSGCIAKTVSQRGFSVAYLPAHQAFAAFEEQKFSRDEDSYASASEQVRRILRSDLLILDDLGTEMTTSFTQSALYNILNTRLTERKKLLVSTNLGDKELYTKYMPQICSRLLGEFDVIPFVGRDIRAIRKRGRYR